METDNRWTKEKEKETRANKHKMFATDAGNQASKEL